MKTDSIFCLKFSFVISKIYNLTIIAKVNFYHLILKFGFLYGTNYDFCHYRSDYPFLPQNRKHSVTLFPVNAYKK